MSFENVEFMKTVEELENKLDFIYQNIDYNQCFGWNQEKNHRYGDYLLSFVIVDRYKIAFNEDEFKHKRSVEHDFYFAINEDSVMLEWNTEKIRFHLMGDEAHRNLNQIKTIMRFYEEPINNIYDYFKLQAELKTNTKQSNKKVKI